jgi:putative intracellular protease/amidase
MMTRLLTVVTGADRLILKDGTIRRTGFWAEEFVVPHEQFRKAGIIVAVATPGGGNCRQAPVIEYEQDYSG